MRDPSLVRVLQRQSRGKVGLVQHATVAQGADGDRRRLRRAARRQGFRHAIVDAIADRDLEAIGEAAADFALITGGSGIALGLPENFRRRGLLGDGGGADVAARDRRRGGGAVGLVLGGDPGPGRAHARARAGLRDRPARRSPRAATVAAEALAWARPLLGDRPILISATAPPDTVAAVQQRLGRERAGALVEEIMAADRQRPRRRAACAASSSPAARPPARSCRRSASPGCGSAGRSTPACRGRSSLGEPPLALALKSGNFGAPDFFLRAFAVLEDRDAVTRHCEPSPQRARVCPDASLLARTTLRRETR